MSEMPEQSEHWVAWHFDCIQAQCGSKMLRSADSHCPRPVYFQDNMVQLGLVRIQASAATLTVFLLFSHNFPGFVNFIPNLESSLAHLYTTFTTDYPSVGTPKTFYPSSRSNYPIMHSFSVPHLVLSPGSHESAGASPSSHKVEAAWHSGQVATSNSLSHSHAYRRTI